MKKGVAWILAMLLLLGCFSGCDTMELYERLLIHGIGVDKEGEEYLVTVRTSASEEAEGEELFLSRGRSVLEALNNLSLTTGRKPFYAHNYLVVFGQSCAREGLDQQLDFFVRYYNTRPAVKLFLAEDTAQEVVGAQKGGGYLKMSEIQQLASSSRYNGKTIGVDILEFINGLKREGSSSYLPVLKACEEGVELAGTAYFEGYKVKGMLTPEETRGLLAAVDRVENSEAVVESEMLGKATLSLSTKPGRIQVHTGAEGISFTIQIQAEADVSALSGGRDGVAREAYGELEQEVEALFSSQIKGALEKTVLKDGCDVFGFGNRLYQMDPVGWEEIEDSWKQVMESCTYQVEVQCKVLRIEQEDYPLPSEAH